MAVWTPEEIAAVRLLINDTVEPYKFSDTEIEAVLTETDGDLNMTAGRLWRAIAAKYHTMTDITEAGSSRKNSLVFEHALKMANIYDPNDPGPDPEPQPSQSRTNAITRL